MQLSAFPDLALVLFAPWFVILGALYWCYPRQPRDARRRWFDASALIVALLAFVASVHWAHGLADRHHGALWPQVLATSVGYGVFLAALLVALLVRGRWLRPD